MDNVLHKTKNSIPEKVRIELILLLNKSLASISDLYIQLKHAHWNIKGSEFIALHKLFDELAEGIEGQVDIIAERITSLGGTALGTVQSIVANSELREFPANIFDDASILNHLTHNIAILSEIVRNDIDESVNLNDMVSNEIYISLARLLDKDLWFLEAHLQK